MVERRQRLRNKSANALLARPSLDVGSRVKLSIKNRSKKRLSVAPIAKWGVLNPIASLVWKRPLMKVTSSDESLRVRRLDKLAIHESEDASGNDVSLPALVVNPL